MPLDFELIFVFHTGKTSTLRKLHFTQFLIIYLTSYLLAESEGVQSTTDLDVAEAEEEPNMAGLESIPVKGAAGQVMNLCSIISRLFKSFN